MPVRRTPAAPLAQRGARARRRSALATGAFVAGQRALAVHALPDFRPITFQRGFVGNSRFARRREDASSMPRSGPGSDREHLRRAARQPGVAQPRLQGRGLRRASRVRASWRSCCSTDAGTRPDAGAAADGRRRSARRDRACDGADWGPDGTSFAVVRSAGGKNIIEFPIGKPLYDAVYVRQRQGFAARRPGGLQRPSVRRRQPRRHRGRGPLRQEAHALRGLVRHPRPRLVAGRPGDLVHRHARGHRAEPLGRDAGRPRAPGLSRARQPVRSRTARPTAASSLTVGRSKPSLIGLGARRDEGARPLVARLRLGHRSLGRRQDVPVRRAGRRRRARVCGLRPRHGRLGADAARKGRRDRALARRPLRTRPEPHAPGAPRAASDRRRRRAAAAARYARAVPMGEPSSPTGSGSRSPATRRARPRGSGSRTWPEASRSRSRPKASRPGSGFGGNAISPDGSVVAATSDAGPALYPVAGGEPQPIKGAEATDQLAALQRRRPLPLRSRVSARAGFRLPARIFRLDLAKGTRELWKEIAPAGASSLGGITALVIAPDAGAYAYTYGEQTSTLYEVRGIQ